MWRLPAYLEQKAEGAAMAFRLINPLRAAWRYLRGVDITEANARVLARNQAERAEQAEQTRAEAPAGGGTAPPTVSAFPQAAARRIAA